MNRRAHNRRAQRAADKGDLPANMSHGKKNGRGDALRSPRQGSGAAGVVQVCRYADDQRR